MEFVGRVQRLDRGHELDEARAQASVVGDDGPDGGADERALGALGSLRARVRARGRGRTSVVASGTFRRQTCSRNSTPSMSSIVKNHSFPSATSS